MKRVTNIGHFLVVWRSTPENECRQIDLGRKLGISQAHISDLENGRKIISVRRAIAWGQILGCEAGILRAALQDHVEAAGLPYQVTLKTRDGATVSL